MTSFWLILGALVIGLPGAAFIVLQMINQHKRQIMAYEWSAQEVVRRGQRLDEMEKLTRGAQHKIAELTRQKIELEAQVAKLEKRSEEHTSELQSLMRSSYAVFCLKKKQQLHHTTNQKMKIQSTQ